MQGHDSEAGLGETTIVIALKDDLRVLDCLDSVDEAVEVILALNGTPAEVRAAVAAHPKQPVITEIQHAGNLGAAYNAGIEAASGRYILLMDSDCLFTPGTIRRMSNLVTTYPVVKGQVVYGTADQLRSRLTARVREFDEGDYVSALSPPLIYDRMLAAHIGGYHFDPHIHWCEDREFDFRLQLAEIPVLLDRDATIHHDAQRGFSDLRSYWRYGLGEGIAQQKGVFTTPAVPFVWRIASDVRLLASCARSKGLAAAFFYALILAAFHVGTLQHLLFDPYDVKPALRVVGARRYRLLRSIPQHCTELTARQREALRASHAHAGRRIDPIPEYRLRFADAVAGSEAAT